MSERFYYVTTDEEMVTAFKAWQKERRAWGKKVIALGKKLGRTPVTGMLDDERVTAFTRKDGEGSRASDYKGTPWVLREKDGYVRPRSTSAEGRKIEEMMKDVGSVPHPIFKMKGIPHHSGFIGTPGMALFGRKLVLTYGEKVKHDKRWKPLKNSEYWKLVEAREAKK